ncbi:hypothetical protein [Mesorhizobium metallidurans]|uniref:hypothetical protein n=1 Tax=Mesorhizobium metallidurans TaxID=489722 RepID=UPI0003451636|nr:hypothetical protein [Mesorhizobium metallidurans]
MTADPMEEAPNISASTSSGNFGRGRRRLWFRAMRMAGYSALPKLFFEETLHEPAAEKPCSTENSDDPFGSAVA